MFQKWENKQKRYQKMGAKSQISWNCSKWLDYMIILALTLTKNPNLTLTLTKTITNPLTSATLIEMNIFGSSSVYFENFPSFR